MEGIQRDGETEQERTLPHVMHCMIPYIQSAIWSRYHSLNYNYAGTEFQRYKVHITKLLIIDRDSIKIHVCMTLNYIFLSFQDSFNDTEMIRGVINLKRYCKISVKLCNKYNIIKGDL